MQLSMEAMESYIHGNGHLTVSSFRPNVALVFRTADSARASVRPQRFKHTDTWHRAIRTWHVYDMRAFDTYMTAMFCSLIALALVLALTWRVKRVLHAIFQPWRLAGICVSYVGHSIIHHDIVFLNYDTNLPAIQYCGRTILILFIGITIWTFGRFSLISGAFPMILAW